MRAAGFNPTVSGFNSSTSLILGGYGPRATRSRFEEAAAQSLAALKGDYFGAVEAYRLDERLERWERTDDLQACARQAGVIFAVLDYFHAQLVLPGRFERLPPLRRRFFETYFWGRSLDNLQSNLEPLMRSLAVAALLPDEWFPQAVLDRQIKDELNRLRIFREIQISPDLGLPPGGLARLAVTTRETVDTLRQRLATSLPWPVHLIQDPVRVCGNRQVIAYALEENGERLRLAIYEPDCVCPEHALLVDLGGERPIVVEHCPPGPPRPVAGLVCSRYVPVEPPAGVLSRLQRSPFFRVLSWRLRGWARRTGERRPE